MSFGFARDIEYKEYYNLFDIQITNGFSGGGIFNEMGQLQGIISGATSAYSEGSFRPENINRGEFFQDEFKVHDGPWKTLNTMQVNAVSLNFIKEFLNTHGVTNVKNLDNVVLPQNDKDTYFDSFTDQEESEIKSIATPLRKSTVAISIESLSEGNFPNGSGVLITDKIVATNSHVVEGKENPIVTLYDMTEISGSVLDHHPEMDVSLILLDESVHPL